MMPCSDCGRDTDPDDAAPSCGSHILCVSCYTTSDFRCRECQRVWDEQPGEEKAARAVGWFTRVSAANAAEPFPAYVEPTQPPPMDMTKAEGSFTTEPRSLSHHFCANCKRGCHVGRPVVAYSPVATSAVLHHYHPECVVLP